MGKETTFSSFCLLFLPFHFISAAALNLDETSDGQNQNLAKGIKQKASRHINPSF